MTKPDIDSVKQYLLGFQDAVSDSLHQYDHSLTVQEDHWNSQHGGGGRTRAFGNGQIFEKAGVNFSHVWGDQLPKAATDARPELQGCQFQALGVSLIVHPSNPFVPTCHANLRLFVAETPSSQTVWWFGGGFDLTPYYGFEEDCIHWHKAAKRACDPFGEDLYGQYKQWADRYFYLKHRNEPRGIGGLFFDDVNQFDFATCFSFIKSVGQGFSEGYFPIVERRKDTAFTSQERDFQLYRRGRYVEFNLVYDRGTLFGLQSGGRIESILISLPPAVAWHYDWQPKPGSKEAELYDKYLQQKDWIDLK